MSDRKCGSCTLCCKLLAVPQMEKQENRWCSSCLPGKGCMTYESRPVACRDFACLWVQTPGNPLAALGEELRPDRCKVIFTASRDGNALLLTVDPSRPDAWKNGAVADLLAHFLDGQTEIHIVIGRERMRIGGDRRPLMPDQQQRQTLDHFVYTNHQCYT